MLGIDITFKATPLPELEAFYDQIQGTLKRIGDEVVAYNRPDILADMSKYPRQAVHPFQFATAKSRRYYFYLVRSGKVRTDGKRYVRNGGYGKSWQVLSDYSGGVYRVAIVSDFKAARYVGGTLVRNLQQARQSQVAGHSRTGWQLSAKVAQKWYEILGVDFLELAEDEIGSQFAKLNTQRRAYSK